MDVRFLVPGYEIIDTLSDCGGQALVYRARQLSIDNRTVAIKIYRARLDTEDDRLGFLHEVKAMRELAGHHNVVRLDRADVVDGLAYIVMELCDHSLADQLRTYGPLPAGQVVDVALRVCRALTAAHARGILHRDLKPSNLLWTAFGELVVADFGIATLVAAGAGHGAAHGARPVGGGQGNGRASVASRPPGLGTPGYIAPEVLAGADPTVGSDIYALGATLYTLLYGTAPAPGERIADPRVPDALARAIAMALSPDPAHRCASAAEFARVISAASAEPATSAGPVTIVDPSAVAPSDDLAEGWLRGVDVARPPELRPAVIVPTPSTTVPTVGWWAVGLAAAAALLLGAVAVRPVLGYVAGATAACVLAYALLSPKVKQLRGLSSAVLSAAGAALLSSAVYVAVFQPERPLPGVLAGVGCVGLLVAGASRKITSRQVARSERRARELATYRAIAEQANHAFEGSGRAPSWLTRLLALPAVRLYRFDHGPFEYAAACGSRTVAFAVVHWHRGRYATLPVSPYVARNEQAYRQGGADMHAVVEETRRLGRHLDSDTGLLVLVVITRDGAVGDGVLTIDTDVLPGLAFATPETATDRAGAYLAADPYHIDIGLTQKLLHRIDQ